jgi:hypothetical protein
MLNSTVWTGFQPRSVRRARRSAGGPDPAGGAPCAFEGLDAFVKVAGGEGEGLADVVWFKLGVFAAQVVPVGGDGEGFDDAADGEAHAADGGLAVQDRGVAGDPFEHRWVLSVAAPTMAIQES